MASEHEDEFEDDELPDDEDDLDEEEDESDEDDEAEDDDDSDEDDEMAEAIASDLGSPFGHRGRPTEEEISEENRMMRRRHKLFRMAADRVTDELAKLPAVQKVAIIGSVASPLKKEVPRFREFRRYGIEILHECGDLDLAVWISDVSDLKTVRKCKAKALNELYFEGRTAGVATHQVELFLLEPGTNRYLGRVCEYNQCPKGKPDCMVPGCGAEKFLQLHEGFHFYPWALDPSKLVVLFDRNPSPPEPGPRKPMMVHVDIRDAGQSFAQLLAHVAGGGKAIITRDGQPVVRMLPAEMPESGR